MLKKLELSGFKSFAKKTVLDFQSQITAIVGPNGSGKSNCVEAVRFVLGEQSMKSLRGKAGADLIFQGSKNLAKQNRAAVSIYFDNTKRNFFVQGGSASGGKEINLDFDEILITREVYSDGGNRYLINGTEVRLKDIVEMLAAVHIGSSGHHIISQGEADRILNASPRERREMIEDALGLKIYQYRLRDAGRKIEKASENMKEVGLLRRELAPHLNYLKKQVEKVEKAEEMRSELSGLYNEYLKIEEIYLESEKAKLSFEKNILDQKISEVEKNLAEIGQNKEETQSAVQTELLAEERKVAECRAGKDDFSRKLGRIEGLLELKESKVKMSGKCPVCGGVIVKRPEDEEELAELKRNKDQILSEIASLQEKENEILSKISKLQASIEAEKEKRRTGDVKKLELQMEKNKLLSEINMLKIRMENLSRAENDFLNEIREGSVLVGQSILNYKNFPLSAGGEGSGVRSLQEERRKKIERIKIRLEDMGTGGGQDTVKEYKETLERDQFLAKELEDLSKTIGSLESLVRELREKLETEFRNGIEKINKQFQEFFALMFGGGTAAIEIIEIGKKIKESEDDIENEMDSEIEENEEVEIGILINVSLPRKKVKELHALSGGERSLTSIALLFAMSQVNPPPFLILDETDAALDEANSKKYGDMLERLAKFSQLILVTHNRETMSRAGVLYGVTVGSDGASKLLSIKFDEAVAIAK